MVLLNKYSFSLNDFCLTKYNLSRLNIFRVKSFNWSNTAYIVTVFDLRNKIWQDWLMTCHVESLIEWIQPINNRFLFYKIRYIETDELPSKLTISFLKRFCTARLWTANSMSSNFNLRFGVYYMPHFIRDSVSHWERACTFKGEWLFATSTHARDTT